ncbi:MAG: hypothetical protein LBI45_03315 [Bacteroidales bacterium]|jgi:hypothetical protein|nr:hypothetical protein [Bacteroidales bacterium]
MVSKLLVCNTVRDVGFDFDKEFNLTFTYKSRSFGGRNPDSVMKDILANTP